MQDAYTLGLAASLLNAHREKRAGVIDGLAKEAPEVAEAAPGLLRKAWNFASNPWTRVTGGYIAPTAIKTVADMHRNNRILAQQAAQVPKPPAAGAQATGGTAGGNPGQSSLGSFLSSPWGVGATMAGVPLAYLGARALLTPDNEKVVKDDAF